MAARGAGIGAVTGIRARYGGLERAGRDETARGIGPRGIMQCSRLGTLSESVNR